MANGDFDLFPQDGESREQHAQRIKDAALAEDWNLRFQANGASLRVLGEALAEEKDPYKVMALVEQRGESLIRSLGSGVLSLWKDDVIAERHQFEREFGQSDLQ